MSNARKLAVATWFPADPESPRGGVEAVSVNLVRELAKDEEWEVHVVTFGRKTTGTRVDRWHNATIHCLPYDGRSMLLHAVGAGRRAVQNCLKELGPAIVHAHDTFGIMMKGFPGPRLFTIHGFIYEDTGYAGGIAAKARALLWERIEKKSWREQPNIIAISPYVRERIAGIATGTIFDIENPIREECFGVVPSASGKIVFSAGALCERKNTLGMLESFKVMAQQDPSIRLRLAGSAPDSGYEKRIRSFIHRNGLHDSVALLGAIPSDRMRLELSRASLFLLLSFEEGAPMVIAEAMAAGVPVVTSNRCGMPYMVRHGENGFIVDPGDSQKVARYCRLILDDADLHGKMAGNAGVCARERYHPALVAERTARVYHDILAEWRNNGR
jgi:glycosyltransferase involved in cell wall biosynthesis